MPAYNCEKYIGEAIESVLNQTYSNWELIIVDDFSVDNTKHIINRYTKEDIRVKSIFQQNNQGAASARNKGIENSEGSYIAFLDSDDVWFEKKLEKQVNFMEKNNYLFSCTYYNKINSESDFTGEVIKYPQEADYNMLLKYCPGNSTVIYNCEKTGKIFIPNIKKRNDYLMWLKVIKRTSTINCLRETLSSHRIHDQSLSSNKQSLINYHWEIYRHYENLSFIRSLWLLVFWVSKSLFRKTKILN